MKGLICEYWDNSERVLCVSDVHEYGVCIADEDGLITTHDPKYLRIVKPSKIPPQFDDWRVKMGFERWNIYGD